MYSSHFYEIPVQVQILSQDRKTSSCSKKPTPHASPLSAIFIILALFFLLVQDDTKQQQSSRGLTVYL
jgi:hypothetical protein